MGDFNDEPFDTSLVTHALSTRQRRRVVDADTPRFWNLSWPLLGDPPDGTFYFNKRAEPARPVPGQQEHGAAELTHPGEGRDGGDPPLPGTFSTGRYPRPKPFGGMGKPVDENGYSDHFPIGLHVTEAD
jgi:hypothetical protein